MCSEGLPWFPPKKSSRLSLPFRAERRDEHGKIEHTSSVAMAKSVASMLAS
jgi:hypothetical protein